MCKIAVLIIFSQVLQIWAAGTPKVEVALYYQSYCPHSVTFIHDQLVPLWKNVIENPSTETILQVKIVPFGFANINGTQIDGG